MRLLSCISGHLEDALALLTEVVSHNPYCSEALVYRAVVHVLCKNARSCIRDLRAAGVCLTQEESSVPGMCLKLKNASPWFADFRCSVPFATFFSPIFQLLCVLFCVFSFSFSFSFFLFFFFFFFFFCFCFCFFSFLCFLFVISFFFFFLLVSGLVPLSPALCRSFTQKHLPRACVHTLSLLQ